MNFLKNNPLLLLAMLIVGYAIFNKARARNKPMVPGADLQPGGTTASKPSTISNPVSSSSTSLRRGSSGEAVKELQRSLNILPVDGVFGTITEAKVKEFQRKYGLTADGIVGPATQAKIKEKAAELNGAALYAGMQQGMNDSFGPTPNRTYGNNSVSAFNGITFNQPSLFY
jgi:peptidoglycan hydrolase-like protein with peptidoglycan-binding domain